MDKDNIDVIWGDSSQVHQWMSAAYAVGGGGIMPTPLTEWVGDEDAGRWRVWGHVVARGVAADGAEVSGVRFCAPYC